MTIETVKIQSVQLDPSNLRKHPERNMATIRGSLARFGQQKPIVVDSRGVILAGNGTFMAAMDLGWQTVQIVRTDLTGSEATAYAIADNRTAELAGWDGDSLADVMASLRAEDADLAAAAGYSPEELVQLLGEQTPPTEDEPPEDFPVVDENIPTDHQCPKCGYRFSGGKAGG